MAVDETIHYNYVFTICIVCFSRIVSLLQANTSTTMVSHLLVSTSVIFHLGGPGGTLLKGIGNSVNC